MKLFFCGLKKVPFEEHLSFGVYFLKTKK